MNVAESTTDTSRSLRGIRNAAMFTRNSIAMLPIRVTPRRKLSDLQQVDSEIGTDKSTNGTTQNRRAWKL